MLPWRHADSKGKRCLSSSPCRLATRLNESRGLSLGGHRSPQPKGKVDTPAEYRDLILHQGFLASKCFLGNALEGHKMSRAPFLGQHHLGEGTPVTEPVSERQEKKGEGASERRMKSKMEEVLRPDHPP